MIRNFIEVLGIAQEEDLPTKSFGQLIKYSEAEHIIVPRDKSGIKDIYQIGIKIDIKSKRLMNTVDSKTVILDGVKNFKIVYTQYENPDKVVMINIQQPYNTFFEVPHHIRNLEHITVHILDAYFQVLEKRRIYGHFVYLVDVRYSSMDTQKIIDKSNIVTVELEDINGEIQIALSSEDFALWDEAEYRNDDLDCEYL